MVIVAHLWTVTPSSHGPHLRPRPPNSWSVTSPRGARDDSELEASRYDRTWERVPKDENSAEPLVASPMDVTWRRSVSRRRDISTKYHNMAGSRHSHSSSSDSSDFEVYTGSTGSLHRLSSSPAAQSRSAINEEDSEDVELSSSSRPTHIRRRSSISGASGIEEPLTRGEKVFMAGSAALVAGLTIAAVSVVLLKAEL